LKLFQLFIKELGVPLKGTIDGPFYNFIRIIILVKIATATNTKLNLHFTSSIRFQPMHLVLHKQYLRSTNTNTIIQQYLRRTHKQHHETNMTEGLNSEVQDTEKVMRG
jgi:hypothetical protein